MPALAPTRTSPDDYPRRMPGARLSKPFIYRGLHEFKGVRRGASKAMKNALRRARCKVLVAPQGFEPRSSESESLVLPLNERAKQVFTAAAGSAGATISRLCECTRDAFAGQPQHHAFCALLFAQNLKRLLTEHTVAGEPARNNRHRGNTYPCAEVHPRQKLVVKVERVQQ